MTIRAHLFRCFPFVLSDLFPVSDDCSRDVSTEDYSA